MQIKVKHLICYKNAIIDYLVIIRKENNKKK